MQKHGLIIDMSCNKIIFWPDHYQHLTIEIKLQRIVLMPSRNKPMRGREEILAQKSERIVLPSSPKEKLKKVLASRDIFNINFGVIESKKRVTSGMKILKKKTDAKTKQKKTASTKKLQKLLPYMLPSAHRY